MRNKEGNLALEVCPDKQCHSALLLALNMKLQHFTQNPSSDAEKLLSKYTFYHDYFSILKIDFLIDNVIYVATLLEVKKTTLFSASMVLTTTHHQPIIYTSQKIVLQVLYKLIEPLIHLWYSKYG